MLSKVSGVLMALMLSVSHIAEATSSNSQVESVLTLQVIDPFVELHTGPGRGYPVFHVVEEGESIGVLTRRPDWYEVDAGNGKIGWAKASTLSRTLEPTGTPVDLPTVSYGDYLKNSWRVGFTAGQFSSGELDDADNFSVIAGYHPLSWLGAEIEYGKTYRDDITGHYYGANLIVEPFSKWRVSPYLLVGTGKMKIDTQPKLLSLDIDESNYTAYGVGGNYYLGRNFVLRCEYRWYSLSSDSDNNDLEEWKIGVSTFF